MATLKLTQARVDAAHTAKPDKGVLWLWDAEEPGLGLRVAHTGRTSWVFTYWMGGRGSDKKRITLGKGNALSLKDARAKAVKARAQVAASREGEGGAPHERRATARRERQAVARIPSVSDAYARWVDSLAGHVKPHVQAEYLALFTRYAAARIGALRVDVLAVADIAALHAGMREKPIAANRMRARLATFLDWCEPQGYRPRRSNPVPDVKPYPEKEKERALTAEETTALLAALDTAERVGLPLAPERTARTSGTRMVGRASRAAEMRSRRAGAGGMSPRARTYVMQEPRGARGSYATRTPRAISPANPFAIAAIRFLLYSGWREQEALSLRWEHVDLSTGVAVLPDTKSGKSRRPLSDAAVAILRAQRSAVDSPFVFPSKRARRDGTPGHLTDLSAVWYAVRHEAKIGGTRLHDLRHTFASTAVRHGVSLDLVGAMLGHRDARSTKRYAKYDDHSLRAGANQVAAVFAALGNRLRIA